jgi:alkylation response protein AidB-like acyl-CoA dehydrogenase
VRRRAAGIDRSREYPYDLVEILRANNFTGMTIPKAYGGQDRSVPETVPAIEEMAKSRTVTARIVSELNMGAISTVMAYGTEAQRQLAAALVLAGDKPAICIMEPDADSGAMAMSTTARKQRNRYVIGGKKHRITGVGVSRLHLILV